MSKLYVGIIFGGRSTEYAISLESAKSIACVIDPDQFEVVLIWIDKCGIWHRDNIVDDMMVSSHYYENNILLNVLNLKDRNYIENVLGYNTCRFTRFSSNSYYDIFSRIDVIFPIVHGRFGEDGTLQDLLRMRKIPFVGSGVLGSALSMDKDFSKRLLSAFGLMVTPFITLRNYSDMLDMNFEYCADILGLPLFIKPSCQGSSIGVSKVSHGKQFYHAVNLAFSLDDKVLVESAIIGRELECAILGNKNPEVSVCGEIVLNNIFYTYYHKYSSFQENVRIIIPAKISGEISDKIRFTALRVFDILQCYGMARVDFFLTFDGHIIINEVNTLPGFTVTSMYPKLWKASGLSFRNLVTILIKLALEVYGKDEISLIYMVFYWIGSQIVIFYY